MIEPVVAEGLAAAAAVTLVAGVGSALPRDRPARRRRFQVGPSSAWVALSATMALVIPAPRLLTVPLAALLAARLQHLVAARKVTNRSRMMDREVPQLLDLLAAASAAGSSAFAAVQGSVASLRGPLGEELRTSLEAVHLGARWRVELAGAAERLALPDLRRAVSVLIRTETLGASLTEATRDLAADVRGARRAAVAERARAAPVKMLFPLVFLILPAFLLLTVVPVLLTTVRSIR